jgi:hypothetical protein
VRLSHSCCAAVGNTASTGPTNANRRRLDMGNILSCAVGACYGASESLEDLAGADLEAGEEGRSEVLVRSKDTITLLGVEVDFARLG